MDSDRLGSIKEVVNAEHIWWNEPMSRHTTFRIGGSADILIKPDGIRELEAAIQWCGEQAVPYYIIGNGSNLLVGDGGIRGVVIQLGADFSDVEIGEDDTLWVQAGCTLNRVANAAQEQGLTGLEFAAGIPGTVGGAVMMNAGAYGGEMKDVVECATLLAPDGEVLILPQDQMEFGYRDSIVPHKNYIVLEAKLRLKKGDSAAIAETMQEYSRARKEKQPLEYPSAGSAFKRPEGRYAGQLIMEAGLAGYRIGDAQVSEKHCGFIINRGQATAKDVAAVMNEVIRRVEEAFHVTLEPEIRRIGEF